MTERSQVLEDVSVESDHLWLALAGAVVRMGSDGEGTD